MVRKQPKTKTLPTGTLTFLFTDIEGSTRLWDDFPIAMKAAHERHVALIVEHVEEHNGVVVRDRGEGDSTFAVFEYAPDAVRAVLAFQRAIADEPWPAETILRVRAALHTGVGEITGRDYNSSDV